MTSVEALKLALSKEEQSIKLYQKLANEHREIEGLLSYLVNEEQKHKIMIEKKIEEVTRY